MPGVVNPRLWTVVLAGGDGQRMQPMINRWLGIHKPKQYCAFVGTRSMFQHTLDRADMLAPPQRRVSVIACSHRTEVIRQIGSRQPGMVLSQPANRDTAAGIFLPLTHIRYRDPHALVVVFPSDHFIFPDETFVRVLRNAVQAISVWNDRILLLGVTPNHPDPDYGWVMPGRDLGWSDGAPVRAVESFVEKPCASRARQAMQSGALWNTMVFVAKVETLWNLGRRCFPDLVARFEKLGHAIGSEQEQRVLGDIYGGMPAYNFSSHLLSRVPDRIAMSELRNVVWSDWGRPERIADILARFGKQPAFSHEFVWASRAANPSASLP